MNTGEPVQQPEEALVEQAVVPDTIPVDKPVAAPRLSRGRMAVGGAIAAAALAVTVGTWPLWHKDSGNSVPQPNRTPISLNLGDRTLTPATVQSLAATATMVPAARATSVAEPTTSLPSLTAVASVAPTVTAEAQAATPAQPEIKIQLDPNDKAAPSYVVGGDILLAPEDGEGSKITIAYDTLPDGTTPPAVEFKSTRYDSADVDPSNPKVNASYLSYANKAENQYLVQEVHSFYPVKPNGKADMEHPEGGELDRKFYQVDWMNVDGRLVSTLTMKEMDDRIKLAKNTKGTIKSEDGKEHPVTIVGKWYMTAEGVGRMEKAFADAAKKEQAGEPVDYDTLNYLNFVNQYDGPSSQELAAGKGKYIMRITCALQASDEPTVNLKQYGVEDPLGLKARRIVEIVHVAD